MIKENNISKDELSQSLAKKHCILVAALAVIFGIYSLAVSKWVLGAATVLAGAIILVVGRALRSKPVSVQGTFLTLSTCVIIAALGAFDGALFSVYPLLVANFAIGGIYTDIKTHKYNWVLTDIFAIASFFAKDIVHEGATMNTLIVGILGLNVGAIMLYILIQEQIKSINSADEKTRQVDSLLGEVKEQVAVGDELMAKQKGIMKDVTAVAINLDQSSNNMKDIASNLTDAANEQANYIGEIQNSIAQFAQNTEECLNVSIKASESAMSSAKVLNDNAENMENMQTAMKNIEETSDRISGIIKTIEDISFQTNILALNAAVEAARAGEAGKGFAVVADEVRNLAAKAADAAKSSATLINESIEAVHAGTSYANTAVKQMEDAIERSKESEAYSREMARLIEEQKDSMDNINSRVNEVSIVVNNNTTMASQSADIASSLANEVHRMNEIVRQQ